MADKQQPRYLLLLPRPPQQVTWNSLSAKYQPPVASVLHTLASETRRIGHGVVLEIALPVPHLLRDAEMPRAALYAGTQSLVAGIYKLICVLAAKESINVEDHEGIDVRVLLVAYDPSRRGHNASSNRLDPVISIETLASSGRSWEYTFVVKSDEGEEILHDFLSGQLDKESTISRVPGGSEAAPGPAAYESENQSSVARRNYTSVAIGGTFDHIHIGHKLLLTMFAFVLAGERANTGETRSLTFGITGDGLLKEKKYRDHLESWDQRQAIVLSFMRSIMDFMPIGDDHIKKKQLNESGTNGHAIHVWLGSGLVFKLVEINDVYGPTITDEEISAMVLTAETRKGGKAVNDKRKEKGWAELELFEVDVLDPEDATDGKAQDENFQAKLSSTNIRKALSEKAQMRSKV